MVETAIFECCVREPDGTTVFHHRLECLRRSGDAEAHRRELNERRFWPVSLVVQHRFIGDVGREQEKANADKADNLR